MLKNIMKAGLIAAMMVGAASMAVAQEVKVGARYGMYFGQLNTGVEGSAARFQTYGESGLIVKASAGKASFTLHPEFRTGDEMNEDASEFYDVVAYGSYVSPVGLVSIGTMQNSIAYGVTNGGGGVKAAMGGLGAQLGPTLAGATEGDGVQLLVPLMNKSLLIQATMFDKALVKFRTLGGAGLNQATNGTTQALGVRYMMGPLTIAAGMTNETVDNYDSDADEAVTNSYSQFSAGYTFGSMTVNVASVSSLIKEVDKVALNSALAGSPLDGNPSEFKIGVTSLGFQMKELGPGKLNINYEAVKFEDTSLVPDAVWSAMPQLAPLNFNKEIVATSLFYSIDVAPGIGYQIVYDSKASTPTPGDEKGDTTTKTYMGVGLYGRF